MYVCLFAYMYVCLFTYVALGRQTQFELKLDPGTIV
jgi:hypothetical protein